MEIRTTEVCGRSIDYRLTRKKGLKNINLRIKPDLTVNVSAAPEIELERIEQFVTSQGAFIIRALEKYTRAAENAKKGFADGDLLLCLGRPYSLVMKAEPGYPISGEIRDGRIYASAPDVETAQRVVTRLLNERLKAYIVETLPRIHQLVEPLGVPVPEVRLKCMTSCWGSCMPAKNRVAFSTALHEYPTEAIDYVILHELAHFLYQNHSKDFYAVIERFMPDWKQRRNMLKDEEQNRRRNLLTGEHRKG